MFSSLHTASENIGKLLLVFKDKVINENIRYSETEIQLRFGTQWEMGRWGGKLLESFPDLISIDRFIEVILKSTQDGYKIRSRTDVDKISSLQMTPGALIENIKNSNYEKKTILLTEKILDDKIYLCLATEVPVVHSIHNSNIKIQIFYVTRIRMRVKGVKNWIVEFKMKYELPLDSERLCSIILSSPHPPDISTEIEYTNDIKDIDEHDINDLKSMVFNQFFMTNIPLDRMFIDIMKSIMTPVSKISMNTIVSPHNELLRGVDNLHWYVTPKIDGFTCFFILREGMVYINSKNSSIWKSYPSSSKDEFYGRGECVWEKQNNITTMNIFPFFVYYPSIGPQSRIHHLTYLFTSNEKEPIIEDPSVEIIAKKFLGPFGSRENRCKAILELLRFSKYPTDGLIFMNGQQIIDPIGTSIVDYKFKQENTVDVTAVCMMNDSSFGGHPNINKKSSDLYKLRINLYSTDNNKIVRLAEIIQSRNKDLYFYPDTTPYFTSKIHGETFLHFHKNIVECLITPEGKYIIVTLRPDKSNALYNRRKPAINNLSMIKDLIKIQRSVISTSVLEELSNNFDGSLMIPREIKDAIRNDNNILDDEDGILKAAEVTMILNKDLKYFTDYPPTTIGVLTHFIKSNIIYNVCSPLLSSIYPTDGGRSVLMIDGGTGADVRKYTNSNITNITITDVNMQHLIGAKKTLKNIQNIRDKGTKGTLSQSKLLHASILDDNYITRTKEYSNKFDVIESMFALHYSLCDETWDKVMNVFKSLSSYGTKIIITCIDGDKFKDRFKKSDNGTLKYKVGTDTHFNYTFIDETKYRFAFDNRIVNPMEEFFIPRDKLIASMKNNGFELVSLFNFREMFDDAIPLFESGLYTLETQESPKMFFGKIRSVMLDKEVMASLSDYFEVLIGYFFVMKSK
jgi:hypothetical protein